MRCPYCAEKNTHVIDTREADQGETVRRRRECDRCGERFTTFERVELRMPRIIKSDDRREAYNENKLRQGLNRALEKRAVDTDKIETSIFNITRQISSTGEREIQSKIIGELVMQELAQLDEVAFVRFASVYRQFQGLEAFKNDVDRLLEEARKQNVSKALEKPIVKD